MINQQKRELKLIELQKSVNKMRAQDFRSQEMHRIRRKAGQHMKIRRIYLEFEREKLYTNMEKDKKTQAKHMVELEQDQQLAQVVADLKCQKIVETKTNELFRKNSHELQCFEKQMQTAHFKKELTCQIKENEALKKEEKVKEYYEDLKMIEAGNYGIKNYMEKQAQDKQIKLDYNMDIIEQMREDTEKKQVLALKHLPITIESINNCYSQNKHIINSCFQKEMEERIQIENDLKERKRKEAVITDKCIEEYLSIVQSRTKQHQEIINKKKEEKEMTQKYLFDNLISLTSDTTGKMEMQRVLAIEEQYNTTRLAEKRDKDFRKQQQDEMIEQNEKQLKIKKDKTMAEKEKNSAEAKKQLQAFLDFNTADDEKKCKRRQIMIEYGKELKNSIALRNDLRIEQRSIMKNEYSDIVELERLRLVEVQKKQQIFMEQHAKAIDGFFWSLPCSKKK